MKRVIKVSIICAIEIDDEVDLNNKTKLYEALKESVNEDLFFTEYLSEWDELDIEDMGEVWED